MSIVRYIMRCTFIIYLFGVVNANTFLCKLDQT